MNRTGFLVGGVFGFMIAAAGLAEYDTIHNALLLRDPYVFLLMGSAVGVAAPLLWLLGRLRWRTPLGGPLEVSRSPVERKHVLGAVVFGAGWAVAGSCPGPAAAMVAGGGLLGLPVMAGLLAGIVLRDRVTHGPLAAGRLRRDDAPGADAPGAGIPASTGSSAPIRGRA